MCADLKQYPSVEMLVFFFLVLFLHIAYRDPKRAFNIVHETEEVC